jgi:hypothetical protein
MMQVIHLQIFMVQLTGEEYELVSSSQIVMSSRKHRGLKDLPYVFTEQGVARLSSVLRSPSAAAFFCVPVPAGSARKAG